MQIKSLVPTENQERPSLKSIVVAVRYAISRQELIGTYVIDFVAMVFAMPNALFPAMAVMLGGPLLGNAQVDFLAAMTSTQFAILIGGLLCVVAVCFSIFLLPAFWKYHANNV